MAFNVQLKKARASQGMETSAQDRQLRKLKKNPSFFKLRCNECAQESTVLIELDDGDGIFEGHNFNICLPCIQRAAELAKEGEG